MKQYRVVDGWIFLELSITHCKDTLPLMSCFLASLMLAISRLQFSSCPKIL